MATERDARWAKHRCSVERWKANNYPYYLEQKRRLAGRPEYLARRRDMYAATKAARPMTGDESLSALQNVNESAATNEAGDRGGHRRRRYPPSAQERDRAGAAAWTTEESAGQPGGSVDRGW